MVASDWQRLTSLLQTVKLLQFCNLIIEIMFEKGVGSIVVFVLYVLIR
jgi:hypothetical protein